MYSDIDSSTSAIEHHHDGSFSHLGGQRLFSVISALNRSTFRLKAKQEISTAQLFNNSSPLSGFSHELFLILGPQSWHCKHPSDLVLLYLANLLLELFNSFV